MAYLERMVGRLERWVGDLSKIGGVGGWRTPEVRYDIARISH